MKRTFSMQGERKGRWTFALAAMVLALLISLLCLGQASFAQPASEGSAGSVDLTPGEREEFVEGARKVAGLNDAEIAAALKDPAMFDAIPVSADVQRRTGTAESPARAQAEGSRAAGRPSYCRTLAARVSYSNADGQVLAYLDVKKPFCWNYVKITYLGTPEVAANVTVRAYRLGWRYKGFAEQFDRYVTYKDFNRGGHETYRRAIFDVCDETRGCYIKKRPIVSLTGYYDGESVGYTRK